MAKESKIDALRKMREEAWQRQQEAGRSSSKRKAGSTRSADDAVASPESEPAHEPPPSEKLAKRAGPKPNEKAGSAPSVEQSSGSKFERAVAALKPRELDEDEVRCPGCGKIRAVRNGKIAAHQKGLGKPCPGSRKPI